MKLKELFRLKDLENSGVLIISIILSVPDGIDLAAVDALLRSQPGVTEVHDLHVWAMSTTECALTAHLVMPAGHPGDAALEAIAGALQRDFSITHPTLQIELESHDHGCHATIT
jgi:cobalt-zinc-cadmium efflux system protein